MCAWKPNIHNIINVFIFNRPGVARAVLQIPLSFTDSLTHWLTDALWKYLQNTFSPKPWELQSWHFERMITSSQLSCVTCHITCVTCHVSLGFFQRLFILSSFSFHKWSMKSVEGLLSTRPIPSSFQTPSPLHLDRQYG